MLMGAERLRNRKWVDMEELSVGAAAVALTKATTIYFDACAIELETAPVRLRSDGTDPTSGTGHFCVPGSSHLLSPDEAQKLKAIRTTAVNGLLRAIYYSRG